MIKLTGREVTPELEQTIRSTAEAAVYLMKQKDIVVPAPITVINSVPTDTVPMQEPVIPPAEPQLVVYPVQQPV